MARMYSDITKTVGHTPLVRINKLNKGGATVLVKMESFNPLSSVKDRVGVAMIEDAEKKGLLKPGATLIEPTSGNTGVGLAFAAAAKGYKLTIVMPETMSIERRKLVQALGANLVLTEGTKGMPGAIAKANELKEATPGAVILGQFVNPANPEIHYRTTGPEIWEDSGHNVDVFVAGVGTGGTVSGVGRYLKEVNPHVHIVAVEPATSPVLSGGKSGPHKIQGIGAGFIPSTYDAKVVDEVYEANDQKAGETSRAAAREEGLLIGISSGAALEAALTLSRDPKYAGKTIVALLPDTGERYLSTWLFADLDA
ncbi:MAG: cysteine synthase A [Sphaerochaetaceae bacterium]|nr:cysteine synthase A [Spirochaetales bacterium]MDY5500628.1 cysteine synthase A [Sphaerochaetaceae bacterium]